MLRFIDFLTDLFDGLFMPPLVPVFSGWQGGKSWDKGDWFNNHTGFPKRPSVHRRRFAPPPLSPVWRVLCTSPAGAIIGEPSHMRAVRAHKGKAAARITIRGRSGHSSRPDQGLNAIHLMTSIMAKAVETADALTRGPFETTFEPPYSSLQIGTVKGGQVINIIPDFSAIELEARAISGVSPLALLQPVRESVEAFAAKGIDIDWTPMSDYPALSLAADTPLVLLLEELTGTACLAAVSYGTEAGLFQAAGIDAIICGPGDIGRAHKPDEFITTSELSACQSILETLGRRCTA